MVIKLVLVFKTYRPPVKRPGGTLWSELPSWLRLSENDLVLRLAVFTSVEVSQAHTTKTPSP
jgi:hypothetical protein